MNDWNLNSRRPGRGPVAASVVLHVFLLATAWWLHRQADSPIEYIAYEMEIVSMAEVEEMEAALPEPEEVVQPDPDPEPPEPDLEPDPEPPEPDPIPDPEPPPADPDPEPPPEPEPPRPDPPEQRQDDPPPPQEETQEESAVDMAVRMEGLRRDFPAYYTQIQTEIARCFRPPTGIEGGTTVLRFEIQRDGRISGSSIQVHQRSGISRLDIAAVGAVECAGGGRLDPLPDALPFEQLPVQFTFSPGGARGTGGE